MASPLLRKKSLVAAAIETAEFTPIAIDATHALFVVQDVSFKADPTLIERNFIGPSFARKRSLITNKIARVNFTTELVGSSDVDTATNWAGTLLVGCGFVESNNVGVSMQYDPVTNPATYGAASGNVGLTMWVYEDGTVKKIRGARGTVKFRGESGSLAYADWEFLGVYVDPAVGAYPNLHANADQVLSGEIPPIVEDATFSFQGAGEGNVIFTSFDVDIANSLIVRPDASSNDGILATFINDRLVQGTLDPEQITEAAGIYDDDAGSMTKRFVDGLVGAYTITIGTATGNKVTISAPAAECQITSVDEGDRDGILTNPINLQFNVPLVESATDKEIRITTL